MNVMMNVDVYDKTKYLESAVFVFVREGGCRVILSISVTQCSVQCDHNIDINPSLVTRAGPLTHSIRADD